MAVKTTAEIGSKAIRSASKKVIKIDSPLVKKIIQDLIDTMRSANLVGMAAPQIGVNTRIFITELRKTKFRKNIKDLDPLRVFINPLIVSTSKKEIEGYEGCGSVASGGLFGLVKRPERINIKAFNENEEEFELETEGLLARVIQHEIDHLNGICFIDKVTDTKKLLGAGEFVKMTKSN
ncbi:MAG: Peptide deformylase [Candidatus Nomurabacteria bacterium]|nr:Peptide deformylase [Candidatus Nomurabacteria bacterium]